ncbi:hypothetical protein P885DRAFT_71530 [Corynascus similis CBS 632.67]
MSDVDFLPRHCIGGLTAALGLRQQGHRVTLYEGSKLAQETGAALHLTPNCYGILQRFGVLAESFEANPVNGITGYDGKGKQIFNLDLSKSLSIWQHTWLLAHRVSFHDELKRKVLSPDGEGTPAILNTSSPVTAVDTETATVTLEDGSSYAGDLVLAADGVSVSKIPFCGSGMKPFGSGKSAFRFMVSVSQIRENPVTEALVTRDGYMTMFLGDDRRLVMYPCSNNTTMNFVAIHPSELSASKGEGQMDREASKEVLLDVYNDFGPVVRTLLDMADSSALRVWTLLDMDEIPTWYKGRLVLLGDAVHPILPHQGQGAAMAIEDAASLCALLPRGTTASDIPERLALYERVRDERAHKVQTLTRLAGMDLNDANRGNITIMEFMKYHFEHDEWHNSTRALRELLWTRNGPVHRRAPLSFGSTPSPRQDHYGRPILDRDSHFTTYTVRFRTSATYLKTLFPTPEFSFFSPGTVAEASFRCTELRNLAWLGKGGYKYLGLWVHGVQYTRKDGSKVHGSFLTVLLGSLADPVISGREELGMPKLFADIEIKKAESSASVECSWGGQRFLHLHLDGLQEAADNRAEPEADPQASFGPHGFHKPKEAGTLFYRYVPAVGKPGEADAAYAVLVRERDGGEATRTVKKTYLGQDCQFELTVGDWSSLPTLHHVAVCLSEIPIYGTVAIRAEDGVGQDDFVNAERIE